MIHYKSSVNPPHVKWERNLTNPIPLIVDKGRRNNWVQFDRFIFVVNWIKALCNLLQMHGDLNKNDAIIVYQEHAKRMDIRLHLFLPVILEFLPSWDDHEYKKFYWSTPSARFLEKQNLFSHTGTPTITSPHKRIYLDMLS